LNKTLLYKSLAAFVLLAAVLLQSFSKVLLIADYYTNSLAYAKNCENKLKPKLKCKGKCQMIKKIKREEKEEKQNPGRNAENNYESQVSFVSLFDEMIILQLKEMPSMLNVPHSMGHTMDRSICIFHPPQA